MTIVGIHYAPGTMLNPLTNTVGHVSLLPCLIDEKRNCQQTQKLWFEPGRMGLSSQPVKITPLQRRSISQPITVLPNREVREVGKRWFKETFLTL